MVLVLFPSGGRPVVRIWLPPATCLSGKETFHQVAVFEEVPHGAFVVGARGLEQPLEVILRLVPAWL